MSVICLDHILKNTLKLFFIFFHISYLKSKKIYKIIKSVKHSVKLSFFYSVPTLLKIKALKIWLFRLVMFSALAKSSRPQLKLNVGSCARNTKGITYAQLLTVTFFLTPSVLHFLWFSGSSKVSSKLLSGSTKLPPQEKNEEWTRQAAKRCW